MPESDLGPRVIGDAKVQAFQEHKAALAHVLGPRVTGPVGEPLEGESVLAASTVEDGTEGDLRNLEEGPTADEFDQYPLAQLAQILRDQPNELDRLIDCEDARADKRIGAMALFRATELSKGTEAREEVLARIALLDELARAG